MESPNRKLKVPDLPSKVRMADTPRPVKSTNFNVERKFKETPKAIRLGFCLYLVQDPSRELSDFQRSWIAHFATKLDESQLFRAFAYLTMLQSNNNFLYRALPMINYMHSRIPTGGPRIPERRRIGIGYRDKGALRPLYQKREFGSESFWDEDIRAALPFSYDIQGKYLTAVEVKSLVGENLFELVMLQLERHLPMQLKNRKIANRLGRLE